MIINFDQRTRDHQAAYMASLYHFGKIVRLDTIWPVPYTLRKQLSIH
ncbi:hypothetical protein [Bacillus cereus]